MTKRFPTVDLRTRTSISSHVDPSLAPRFLHSEVNVDWGASLVVCGSNSILRLLGQVVVLETVSAHRGCVSAGGCCLTQSSLSHSQMQVTGHTSELLLTNSHTQPSFPCNVANITVHMRSCSPANKQLLCKWVMCTHKTSRSVELSQGTHTHPAPRLTREHTTPHQEHTHPKAFGSDLGRKNPKNRIRRHILPKIC